MSKGRGRGRKADVRQSADTLKEKRGKANGEVKENYQRGKDRKPQSHDCTGRGRKNT